MKEFISNVFGNVANMVQFVIWCVAFIIFLISLCIKKKKTKIVDEEMKEISVNKENQKKEEENMAKMFFLCDKCGTTVNAENGVKLTYKGVRYDFCENCGRIIRGKIDEKSKAEINFVNAENIYNNAKSKLESINKDVDKILNQEENKEENKNTTDDIKTKLGI